MPENQAMPIQRFLDQLQSRIEDRGLMADLRRGFNVGAEHRTWPHIAPWCDLTNERERIIWQTVGAGFATLEATSPCGNLGVSLRKLALTGATGKPEDALKSFDGRFRRLLTCETALEVCPRLIPIIRAAKRKNVPIDFEKLFLDLQVWEVPASDVKIRWAGTYWSGDTDQNTKEGGEES